MKKILIIDDDEMMLSAMRISFQGEGYTVVTALDGPEGIDLYRQHWPDVVLLDLNMPTMLGLDVLDRLKEIDADVKIVIITGYASPEVMEESTRKGAFSFYDKALDVEILQDQVERACEQRRKRSRIPSDMKNES